MTTNTLALAADTGSSVVVDQCQVCGCTELNTVLFLGYMPPVNQMRTIGEAPREQPAYPAPLLHSWRPGATAPAPRPVPWRSS